MTAKLCVIVSIVLCAISVYFNRRSDAWADRCLFLAYTALFFAVLTLWR